MSKMYAITRERLTAISTKDGIMISSSKFPGEQQPMCVYVYRNEDGEIESAYYNQSLISRHLDWKEEHPEEDTFVKRATPIITLIISMIFATIAILGNKWVTISAITFWVILSITEALYNISYLTALTIYHYKVPSLPRYHGAEHMAIKAFERLHRIPTMEEIKEEDIYDGDCSSVHTTLKPTLQSLINSLVITVTLIPAIYGFIYVINNFQGTWIYGLLFLFVVIYLALLEKFFNTTPILLDKGFESNKITRFIQWTVIHKPTQEDLDVALTALRMREKLDETIQEDIDGFICEGVNFSLSDKCAVFSYKNGKMAKVTLNEYISQIRSYLHAEMIEEKDIANIKNRHTHVYDYEDEE